MECGNNALPSLPPSSNPQTWQHKREMEYLYSFSLPSSSLASAGHPPSMERVLHVLPAQARIQNLFVSLFKLGLFFLPFIQGQSFLLETSFFCVQEKIIKIAIYSILQAIKQLILIKVLQTRN